jgi:hypothetical protein
VWYDASNRHRAVFQEDEAAMTIGASFNVMVGTKQSGGASAQAATSANTGGDSTYISNSRTTGNPNAVVLETPDQPEPRAPGPGTCSPGTI